jgi:hypothetical protein
MDISTEYEKLKQKILQRAANQKKAYLKYYENNKDSIIQKVKEYKNKNKEVKEPKELTPEQQKKAEYNKRYQEKLKQKHLTSLITE